MIFKFKKGGIYRLGVSVKEQGERMAHVRVFGIHFLNWIAGPVISLGLAIRGMVANCPIVELR